MVGVLNPAFNLRGKTKDDAYYIDGYHVGAERILFNSDGVLL